MSLVQCLPAAQQGERAAAFSGEMGAVAGTARMEMRIEVLERLPGESAFQEVVAPGLGGWRLSAPGVKQFKYIKQVTNLAAPADYRASVRFRWLSARGRLIKAEELHTARCEQPAPMELPPEVGTPAPA